MSTDDSEKGPPAAAEISKAKIVKDFVAYNNVGVLSTHSRSLPGYPFGSVVPYDVTASGDIVIFISRISEHYRNLVTDEKASLLIADSQGTDARRFGSLRFTVQQRVERRVATRRRAGGIDEANSQDRSMASRLQRFCRQR